MYIFKCVTFLILIGDLNLILRNIEKPIYLFIQTNYYKSLVKANYLSEGKTNCQSEFLIIF